MRYGSRLLVLVLLPSAQGLAASAAESPPEATVCSPSHAAVVSSQPEMPSDGWGLDVPGTPVQPGWPEIQAGHPRRHESLAAVVGRWLGPPPGRHRGVGCPLEGENWLDEPLAVGWFIGAMHGGTVVKDWVGVETGLAGGFRIGGDVGHYWGFETRLTCAELNVDDHPAAIAAQWDADTAAGMDDDDPRRRRFDAGREATLIQWDLSVLYYPWGEAAWRPYLAAGLGRAEIELTDRLSRRLDKTMLAVPVAIGVKYRVEDWMALRVEVADMINVSGGGQFETLHNLTYTAGAELRFGGRRRAYWPWNPGRHYW